MIHTNHSDLIHIDGSVFEGGGQLLRLALVFSSILNKSIHITNIRQHRKSPGMQAEHVATVGLAREMCKAHVEGMNKNSQELIYKPRNLTHDLFHADTLGTGSITHIMQVALPLAMFSSGISEISIKGATNTHGSPSLDYYQNLWDPLFFKFFGTNMEIRDIRRGFYPHGRGEIFIEVYPVQNLRSIDLTEFGEVVTAWGRSMCTTETDFKVPQLMAELAEEYLLTYNKEIFNKINIQREQLKQYEAYGNGSAIYLFAETSTRAILSAGLTVQKYRPHNETAIYVASEFSNLLNSQVCIDKYTQDQIILFMTLAKGKSRIKTGPITLHTKTAIHIAELMTNVKFNIIPLQNDTNIIECEGIGFQNKLIDRQYV